MLQSEWKTKQKIIYHRDNSKVEKMKLKWRQKVISFWLCLSLDAISLLQHWLFQHSFSYGHTDS